MHHDVTIYERMLKKCHKVVCIDWEMDKEEWHGIVRVNFMKKIVCDSYVTLAFYQKISPHTTLHTTMYLVFEKMPFFVVSSMISGGNWTMMRDLLFLFCMYHVTWLFPDQYSYFVCCGLRVIYYKCHT